VAYAHRKKIIHCDIKPENMILLPDGRLQLADFGIARVAQHTVIGSGSGTVGYMAPEQAMGRPSTKSDVFSLGLIMYRMFTGTLPEWPFDWPMKGYASLRRRAHPDLVAIMRKAMEVRPSKRYRDADEMLATLQRVKRRALLFYNRKRKS
jgi:eukaryotic-like serine/threonine-protein kinase